MDTVHTTPTQDEREAWIVHAPPADLVRMAWQLAWQAPALFDQVTALIGTTPAKEATR